MQNLDEFISFAGNSRIVVADYESRLGRLQAMITLRNYEGSCPLLDKWIADAHRHLEVMRTLYQYALTAQNLPMQELVATWNAIKELKET
jgi:hypothetical protein